ncbi:MAG: SGNH/GDSL hydrolase family protein [Cyanobacteria bacterium P01_D01_bin.156]
MKILIFSICFLITSLIAIEIALRLLFGFGDPPLYVADDTIGYLLAPNQRVRRFGNRIVINQYSMRSDQVQTSRPVEKLRVFVIGDSIINGNWWTDQTATLSALLQQQLIHKQQQPIEVLNASANSWGPRNELAYLKKFGTFESQIVLLVINTDDLFGTQPTSLQVGKDRSYPDKKPALATLEILNRFRQQAPIPGLKEIQNEKGDRIGKNLSAIQEIKDLVAAHSGQLLLAMTPLKREVLDTPRDYEIVARQRVDQFVKKQQIPYLDFLATFQTHVSSETLYRDHIHLSPTGNSLVSQALNTLILENLPQSLEKAASATTPEQ